MMQKHRIVCQHQRERWGDHRALSEGFPFSGTNRKKKHPNKKMYKFGRSTGAENSEGPGREAQGVIRRSWISGQK